MKAQHLLVSAAVIAAQAPSLVGAFSSTSSLVGGAPAVGDSRRSRSRSISLHQSVDTQALSELEGLIADLMEVNGGPHHASPQVVLSPGRSEPSPLSMSEAASAHGMPWTDTIGRSDETNPLLYMPLWEWQLDFMKSSLTNLHPIECSTLNDLDVSYNENKEKRARIVNHCYASDEYRKIRMTYYDAGDSVQVFNSVWYPDPKYNLPVLGIDLLSFNRKKYLAIVDFQPLHEDEEDHAMTYEHILQPIKDKYDNLKGRMSSKFYDETQFFSKEMLFARFDDEKIVEEDLFPAFKSYVKTHLDLVKDTSPAASSKDVEHVLDRHTAYDTYSADRDPAAGLFAAMFGKEWSEDFIYDFLFSLSVRSEEGLDFSPPGPPRPRGVKPSAGGPPPQHAAPAAKDHSKKSMPVL
eukprot:CAMPEP_0172310168 /NCGR_PEP_ID=MMETSP1058-20130122/11332_1 /TAXON_ID=83371 /ORGANISM="Detonula confervacea, Strain CCMP 353" /LENGTH=407 /DNA_ID=CAMNT_0013022937 /DNA_START=92 /DNA_END=1315 /DNA_ORIENTATION=-